MMHRINPLIAWAKSWREMRARHKSRFVAGSLATDFEFRFRSEVAAYIRGSGGSITSLIDVRFGPVFINTLARAADSGWQQGGEQLPLPAGELASINDVQLGALPGFRAFLQEMRKEYRKAMADGESMTAEQFVERAKARVGLWANSIRGTYAHFLALARGRKRDAMVTWRLGMAEHCTTCNRLAGQRHSMSWFQSRNYLPGTPGAAMDCGGFNCACSWVNDADEVVTV